MPTKKKVKEVTGVYQPFWTKETLATFGANTIRSFSTRNQCDIMEYHNQTHLPFYVLPKLDQRYADSIHYQLSGTDGERLPSFIMSRERDKETVVYLRYLWSKGLYSHFMMACEIRASNTAITVAQLKEVLRQRYDIEVMSPVNTMIRLPDNSSCTGALNVIKCAKMGTHFGLGNIHSKLIRTGPWAHPKYLFGRYYLAHLVDVAGAGHTPFNHGGSVHDTQFVPVTLMSLMFKIEHINVIRGYMMNNKEIPAELLELWVDESLDGLDSPHPVRLQFQRNIRKPMVESGVTVRVIKDLDGVMFNRMTPPKFKSIKQQVEWKNELVSGLMDSERMVNGIVTKKSEIDRSLDAIFSNAAVEDIAF